MPECLEAALQYASLGLSIVPLLPHDKKPMIPNWPEAATSDPETIKKWWERTPDAGVGIATGKKSGVFVIDIDPKNGGEDSYEEMVYAHGQFETWTDITGSGGRHFYFRTPDFPIRNTVNIMPGIDIRGDGGQVVAPPSIHPNGKRYEWDGCQTPLDGAPLAPAPKWLLEKIKRHGSNSITRVADKVLPAKLEKGKRHPMLVSMAGTMRNRGCEYQEIFETLTVLNVSRCEPPLHEKEIKHIAESITKYRPGKLETERQEPERTARGPQIPEPDVPPPQPTETDKRPFCYQCEDLMADESVKLPEMAIDGILPTRGVVLLGGRPKDCKSWLAVQMACALVTGKPFGGRIQVLKPGRAHLWALEDQFSLTRDKLLKLYPHQKPDGLQDLKIFADLAHPIMRGGSAIIQRELDESPAELIILDSLMKLCGERNPRADIVQSDYAVIDCARKLAIRNKCVVVIVMHTRKGSMGGDPITNLMGTTGNTAAADVLMELKKTGRAGKLTVRGRCLPSEDFDLSWWDSECWGWAIQGSGDSITVGEVGQDVLAYLEAQGSCRPNTIAAGLHKGFSSVWNSLLRLHEKGLVCRDLSKRWMLKK